jgi:hypothetical protein
MRETGDSGSVGTAVLERTAGGFAPPMPAIADPAPVADEGLFRSEAIAAQAGERWGRPTALVQPGWGALTLLLAGAVAAAGTFVSTATY